MIRCACMELGTFTISVSFRGSPRAALVIRENGGAFAAFGAQREAASNWLSKAIAAVPNKSSESDGGNSVTKFQPSGVNILSAVFVRTLLT
ncbi:MAG TPA: hypothetical protein VMU86_01330 [Steroidobacteraceae bacterium]|nr:hypothetical protein [Steroidobacteraceae bacterium]